MIRSSRVALLAGLFTIMAFAPICTSGAWPPGKLTNTQTTTSHSCTGGPITGTITTYSNWTYEDSSGVKHVFTGITQQSNDAPGLCPTDVDTSLVATSGAYTLYAKGPTGYINITNTYFPKYHILSLLYDPPGNESSIGIMDTSFNSVTNSISNTFSAGISYTYTSGISFPGGGAQFSSSVSFTQGYGNTSAFTDTITQGESLSLKATENPIDHTKDAFWIWLNPEVIVTQTGATAATYTVQPPNGQLIYAVRVNVAELQNPITIPLTVLEPAIINGVTYPGLCNICANPLPASECKPSNACGCVASDFAQILATDPIISITGNTFPSDTKRYVPLTTPPSPLPVLEAGTSVGFTLTDQDQSSQTQTETSSYSTSFSTSLGGNTETKPIDFTFDTRVADTFTWTQSVSLTQASGSSHQMNLTLGTSTAGCTVGVDIYEDYAYHTFVAILASPPPPPCESN